MSVIQSPNEAERLAVLAGYVAVLDESGEAALDDLARLAAQVCGTPVALVTLIDADRAGYKAKVGIAADGSARGDTFCSHILLGDDLFVVTDAAADRRFSSLSLVTADPKVRFYAGVPLRAPSGHALGTLCVMDRGPRTLSAEQASGLRALARQAMVVLEARRTARASADRA